MIASVLHGLAPWAAAVALSLPAGCGSPTTVLTADSVPRVFAIDGAQLRRVRARLQAGDAQLRAAAARLVAEADHAVAQPPVAVTLKSTLLPPSGDPHDYFSLSPYWWPDPSKADGLPYIRRDGETNPESKRDLDQPRVAQLGANLQALALAYYFTGGEPYAAAAARQLRAWFLDPATRMNPHLRYAQLVRGIEEERGSGIIAARWFIEVVDAAGLIASSAAWTTADQEALQQWFRQYLTWLTTSPNGAHERAAVNNHGSWFAAQTASYALFIGDRELARSIVSGVKERIGAQIQADGSQPQELARTRSMHYSNFNVEALSRLAEMGRQLDIDLWHHQAPAGGSIARAVDRLAPYVRNQAAWPGPQLDPVEPEALLLTMRRTAAALGSTTLRTQAIQELAAAVGEADRSVLLYPELPTR
ncbi:MAG: alginate lyase family protein [Gemmatimonadetes bacterium]|nr:alginate lyase family protein [Gemmatimonadota bacterium]